MPSVDEVVAAICRLPIDFHGGNVSTIDLVRRSGYFAVQHDITIEQLAGCLAKDPDLAHAWLRWSEDNRSSPAWYIEALDSGGFEVGYYDHGRTSQVTFDDQMRATAHYIRNYIQQVAGWA